MRPCAFACLLLLAPAGCTKSAEEAPPPPITLRGPNGQVEARAVATRPDHWRIEGARGEKLGKISVESDRVKVKDEAGALKAKVKRREGGLKLEDGAGKLIFKLKQKSAELIVLEDDAGEELGRVEGSRATFGAAALTARSVAEGQTEVIEGDDVRLSTQALLPPSASLVIAHPGLERATRLGLLVFMYTMAPPE